MVLLFSTGKVWRDDFWLSDRELSDEEEEEVYAYIGPTVLKSRLWEEDDSLKIASFSTVIYSTAVINCNDRFIICHKAILFHRIMYHPAASSSFKYPPFHITTISSNWTFSPELWIPPIYLWTLNSTFQTKQILHQWVKFIAVWRSSTIFSFWL